jgi:hypothetical protein
MGKSKNRTGKDVGQAETNKIESQADNNNHGFSTGF